MQSPTVEAILNVLNLIFAAANLILVFSLFAYILTHNLRNSVAQAFAALMGFMTIVFTGDVILSTLPPERINSAAPIWLKFQWLGIAFVPAAYLHLSDALLRTTNAASRLRRWAVVAAYITGAVFVAVALFTHLILEQAVTYAPWATQFTAGPAFWLFGLYFFITSAWGFSNTLWARSRTLTSTSRRRLSYLVASFAAPGLAVYPYLLFASAPARLAPISILLLSLVGNFGIAIMTVIMAYSVAFQGALAPDRVVKHSFVTYLLRGPLLGAFVLGIAITVPRVESILGVPRDTFLIFSVVGGIIAYQVLLRALGPLIEHIVYSSDRAEMQVLRSLDERLLTSGDLRQLMENILTALCDLLRARHGFVVVMRDGQLTIETACGNRAVAERFLQSVDPSDLIAVDDPRPLDDVAAWPRLDGFRIHSLRGEDGESTLGVLAIEAEDPLPPLTDRERALVRQMLAQAEIALEDRRLQQGIFAILKQLTPEIESIQRWRSEVPYPGAALEILDDNPIFAPNFPTMVKDALSHYWGGPGLTDSPLLKLSVVSRKLAEHDNNPARALRAVINDALEALRPEGERSMTTKEWLLYNILDLKYIEGKRARDVAMRLAMSESDLYRKQRAAIDELARAIAAMEREVARHQPPTRNGTH